MSIIKPKVLAVIICMIALNVFTSAQKPNPISDQRRENPTAKEENDYQNLQRARHLLLMKNDIKGLDDTVMRCLVRLEIVRFIYDNDVRNEFDSADAISIDYFEDHCQSRADLRIECGTLAKFHPNATPPKIAGFSQKGRKEVYGQGRFVRGGPAGA